MRAYSFETQIKQQAKAFGVGKKEQEEYFQKSDVRALMVNLDIVDDINDKEIDQAYQELKKEDKELWSLIGLFLRDNIRNIHWYSNRIWWEGFWRYTYAVVTVLFMLAIPALTAYLTLQAATADNYETSEVIGSILTVLLTSLLGIHKLMTSWIEKRKFRSLFFQAKTDLQEVLFGLSDVSVDRAHSGFATADKEGRNDKIYDLLNQGIKNSRAIVTQETKKYFELSSMTSFDLGSILISSADTAKTMVSKFKSHSYDLDKKKEEEREKGEEKKKLATDKLKNQIALRAAVLKLERQSHKEMMLQQSIQELQESDKENRGRLQAELEVVQDKIEELELECLELELHSEVIEED